MKAQWSELSLSLKSAVSTAIRMAAPDFSLQGLSNTLTGFTRMRTHISDLSTVAVDDLLMAITRNIKMIVLKKDEMASVPNTKFNAATLQPWRKLSYADWIICSQAVSCVVYHLGTLGLQWQVVFIYCRIHLIYSLQITLVSQDLSLDS
jgi:hypothetical protein